MAVTWKNTVALSSKPFKCGWCSNQVASDVGYDSTSSLTIYICPHCRFPTTFFYEDVNMIFLRQYPGHPGGIQVASLPEDIEQLYNEMRTCFTNSCYTAAAMLCRKILMNTAVAQGAAKNQTFVAYIDYLSESGHIPRANHSWVDKIRTKGNEANHEIEHISQEDSNELVTFTGVLLQLVYELPARVNNPLK